jgi:hypothetical protein
MTNSPSPFLASFAPPGSRKRRLVIAAAIYVVACVVFAVVAPRRNLVEHTQYNHLALLADAWIHGRQDIAGGPPAYAMQNDFAQFQGKTYITFPPFPALLMLPFVALSGGAESFRDGQFVLWLAGLAPALLFLVLEKLRRPNSEGVTHSNRSERQNAALALLYAFGSVFFFTAVQGTVWFAEHVVCSSVLALYVLFALDATQPLLCGLLIGCAYMCRPPVLLTGVFFALEAIRVRAGGLPVDGTWPQRLAKTFERVDKKALARDYALFVAPLALVFLISSYMNHLRFGTWNPNVGHEYLTVVWAARMKKWGLFNLHFLAKNLGVSLTMLPWLAPGGSPPGTIPFQVNEHGLALWFTTPIYFWLLWPRKNGWLYAIVAITAALPAIMDLLYQNSGWRQFGYRFSNDYAILLFVLLAIGDRAMGWLFRTAAAWGVAWNLFGAVTFDRLEYDKFYFREGTQTVLYQPD